LFRQYLDRYHYQRYRVPFGAHVRYLMRSELCPETPAGLPVVDLTGMETSGARPLD
jgi:hypothetical protein